MRTFMLALAASALLALPAQAEWKKMNGEKVPGGITAKEWINTGKFTPTNADLRGKVYLLEFFATW